MTADMFLPPTCAAQEWPSTRALYLLLLETEPPVIFDAVCAELGRPALDEWAS